MGPACTEGSGGVQVHNPLDRGCPQCPGCADSLFPMLFQSVPQRPSGGSYSLCLLEKETEAGIGHPAELDEPVQSHLLIG